jgi:alkaline phosphatase D
MGRPRQVPPRPAGTTRRDFFRQGGSTALALAATPLLPTGSALAATRVFQHGVASGDPLADRVMLWTRVTLAAAKPLVPVKYLIATDPALKKVVASGSVRTFAARDYTVKVDADCLQPATTYYYRFEAEGQFSPIGRTRTLPRGNVNSLRMAVVSCSNYAYGYFNAYRRIAERADLDLFMHLGDYIYEYGSGQYGSTRPCVPASEIITLADYRARHAQYKGDADLQEVHRQLPMIAIWDDHETANNAWKDGAENHTEGAEGRWADRVAAALQAYYEWMPVRELLPQQPRHDNRAFRFGNLAEFVMLEERLNARDKQLDATIPVPGVGLGFTQTGAFADPTRQLLGTTEEEWLAQRLRTTPATWKFLGQGVMFAQLKAVAAANAAGGGIFLNSDQWDGYQPARDRVYAIVKGDASNAAVKNVVVLTGDIHSSWAADLTQDPNNPDVGSGGYNPATGEGSRAVEFVGTSITSPGIDDPSGGTAAFLRSVNPHFKYIELNQRGYMIVDANASRVVCEWWYVDTVASPSNVQVFGTAFEVHSGSNHLVPSAQTPSRPNPPPLAP